LLEAFHGVEREADAVGDLVDLVDVFAAPVASLVAGLQAQQSVEFVVDEDWGID
jgi:hypothetical protein